jgi:hypothetical protein
VTLAENNQFSGNLVINGGTVISNGARGANATTSNLGTLNTAGRIITVNNGATLSLTTGNVLGWSNLSTIPTTKIVVNAGGVFQTGVNGTGTGYWNSVGPLDLNGGNVSVGTVMLRLPFRLWL